MVFLKEDGSLDIERINNLPLLEYYDMLGTLTEAQVEEYCSTIPLNEMKKPLQTTKVDFTIEEAIASGTMVDAEKFINKMRQNMKQNNG